MSLGLQATKRRIASVTSTKKITKAMELVATAKLKTWKNLLEKTKSYTDAMIYLANDVFTRAEECDSVFLHENAESNKDLYVVITSNLGLCAGYNYQIFYQLDNILQPEDDVLMIGSKGVARYHTVLGTRLRTEFASDGAHIEYATAEKIGAAIIDDFKAGKYHSIKLIYTEYKNSIAFIPKTIQLLPITLKKHKVEKETKNFTIFEPSPQAIVDSLIPTYIKSTIYGKLIESVVSEQASRRTAMENASDNSQEIIDKLNITYNKQRQAAITQDIVEIVG
ncbi:MAG: ATP synthase F1 subunit gamma, partial [Limosilactobacillus mucosae]|nr:ATP synthase F1 subunit gamma [Limosilactobacillus mucosae]